MEMTQEELDALVMVLREALEAIGLDQQRADIAARNQAMALIGVYTLGLIPDGQ